MTRWRNAIAPIETSPSARFARDVVLDRPEPGGRSPARARDLAPVACRADKEGHQIVDMRYCNVPEIGRGFPLAQCAEIGRKQRKCGRVGRKRF